MSDCLNADEWKKMFQAEEQSTFHRMALGPRPINTFNNSTTGQWRLPHTSIDQSVTSTTGFPLTCGPAAGRGALEHGVGLIDDAFEGDLNRGTLQQRPTPHNREVEQNVAFEDSRLHPQHDLAQQSTICTWNSTSPLSFGSSYFPDFLFDPTFISPEMRATQNHLTSTAPLSYPSPPYFMQPLGGLAPLDMNPYVDARSTSAFGFAPDNLASTRPTAPLFTLPTPAASPLIVSANAHHQHAHCLSASLISHSENEFPPMDNGAPSNHTFSQHTNMHRTHTLQPTSVMALSGSATGVVEGPSTASISVAHPHPQTVNEPPLKKRRSGNGTGPGSENLVRNYICSAENCGRAFVIQSALNRHIGEKHRDSAYFLCPNASCISSRSRLRSKFYRKEGLQRHLGRKNTVCKRIALHVLRKQWGETIELWELSRFIKLPGQPAPVRE